MRPLLYLSQKEFREVTSKIFSTWSCSSCVTVASMFIKKACLSLLFTLKTILCIDFDKSYINLLDKMIFLLPKVFNSSTF